MRRTACCLIVLALAVTATGCVSAPRACDCPCHRQHSAVVRQTPPAHSTNPTLTANRTAEAPRYTPPSTSVRSYATGSTRSPSKTAVAPTVPYRAPVATARTNAGTTRPATYSSAGGYVRLRGSPVVHVRGCPKVKRAAPGGAVACRASDGPPCYICRHAEAMRVAQNR